MGVKGKAEVFVQVLVALEFVVVLAVFAANPPAASLILGGVTVTFIIASFLYPTCPSCRKSPWVTAHEGRTFYRPRLGAEEKCSRCGTNLTATPA